MKNYLLSLKQMTKDIFGNLRRIAALAYFEYKLGTKDMFLGGLWKILSPFIQIGSLLVCIWDRAEEWCPY